MPGNENKLVEQLIQNNIILQKKTTELLSSVHLLLTKMDTMVDVFNKAAEHIELGELKEPLEKQLNELLEQNKKIAGGLVLLEKYVRGRETMLPGTSTPSF